MKKGAKIPEKSDVLFLLSYLPPLSYFVPTLVDPPSPLKSDIIYVCSLNEIVLSGDPLYYYFL